VFGNERDFSLGTLIIILRLQDIDCQGPYTHMPCLGKGWGRESHCEHGEISEWIQLVPAKAILARGFVQLDIGAVLATSYHEIPQR